MKKLIVMLALFGAPAFADTPSVKMSANGICHAEGTQYYGRTKTFVEYTSIELCLAEGGRLPK
jgi:hypothetical protein